MAKVNLILPALAVAYFIMPSPSAATDKRYFILAVSTMPAGTAFTVPTSQAHLFTQFALGFLSVQDVVNILATQAP